ncbi:hypothetical protein GCM10010435_94870 [Winogradskya consettensis]|uniref:Uncharacterized protein n=1 Tax=Winogradskya consettensis TaxID=113560 RepID=A0A919SXG7_9ACTN|nr:hypothetical protein Aco04nite_67350 [Actinoplanes consettensis]
MRRCWAWCPYLLGSHPKDSVVAIFLDADQNAVCVSRLDLTARPALAVQQWSRVSVQQPVEPFVFFVCDHPATTGYTKAPHPEG